MKMAKASTEDMARAWKVFRALETHRWRQDARSARVLLGRVFQLDEYGSYFRILGGYETLVANCCDDTEDTLEFSQRIQDGLALLDAQRA